MRVVKVPMSTAVSNESYQGSIKADPFPYEKMELEESGLSPWGVTAPIERTACKKKSRLR
ncbi:hypothetical protein [Bacillus sp. FJAT-44742]|uniref:hypothetical protein n=1 Tax=Bacillus sp. FJAT-44742 TaxID=2014005 RepID=UPI001E5D50EA|nr:hypothetical protein [Bacillus sp. FJAT-44742]